MPSGRPDDLVALLTPPRERELSVTQGTLTAWDSVTHANTVSVNGASLSDLAIVGDPAALIVDSVVLLLRARNTYYVLGRITYP